MALPPIGQQQTYIYNTDGLRSVSIFLYGNMAKTKSPNRVVLGMVNLFADNA